MRCLFSGIEDSSSTQVKTTHALDKRILTRANKHSDKLHSIKEQPGQPRRAQMLKAYMGQKVPS